MSGHVDVYDRPAEGYPSRTDEKIEVPMTPDQERVYNFVMGKLPIHLRLKIRSGLPPSKKESTQLNAFATAVRQASLSPRPYVSKMTDDVEDQNTPKIQRALNEFRKYHKRDPNFRAVVYSNYIGAGLVPYSRQLTRDGISHHVFTGKVSKAVRAQMVRDYNEGKVKALLVSSSGTEGLDLKGTKLIQVLEPHFNNSKVEQVVGRGIRYQSHSHLPPQEQSVRVQRYYATHRPRWFGKTPVAIDHWLQQVADDKDRIGQQFKQVLQEASAQ